MHENMMKATAWIKKEMGEQPMPQKDQPIAPTDIKRDAKEGR